MAGKIKNPAAIFVLKRTHKNHGIKKRAKLQASLAFCSFFFMPGTLMRKNAAGARDFLRVAPWLTLRYISFRNLVFAVFPVYRTANRRSPQKQHCRESFSGPFHKTFHKTLVNYLCFFRIYC